MPLRDDCTIAPDAVLLRALVHPSWIKNESGNRRPSSIAFYEAHGEVSYFIDSPGMVAELRRIFNDVEIAMVPAAAVRGVGFAIERRPADCPDGFRCDRASHVVAGPREEMARNVYEKCARSIAKQDGVGLVPREPVPQVTSNETTPRNT
jgi:hypothetical protein